MDDKDSEKTRAEHNQALQKIVKSGEARSMDAFHLIASLDTNPYAEKVSEDLRGKNVQMDVILAQTKSVLHFRKKDYKDRGDNHTNPKPMYFQNDLKLETQTKPTPKYKI